MLNILRTSVKIGIPAPFKLLHISDTHLAFADERDNKRKRELAEKRFRFFQNAEAFLAEAERYARENALTIAHTGDLIDFVSEANLDRARRFTAENDVFFAAGNHEFSLYVGEAEIALGLPIILLCTRRCTSPSFTSCP